jgi:anaerobic ribonucleoside-triphosphate reductase
MSVDRVVKRDGTVVSFDRVRIENGIYAAARAAGNGESRQWAEALSWAVVGILEERFGQNGHKPHVKEIQDVVEEVLVKSGSPQVAKTYILYRQRQAQARATRQMLLNVEQLVDDYLQRADWRVNENSNMNYSLQGLNFYVASSIAARYWLHKIYPPKVQQAHVEGALHLHDLGMLSVYCCGWDLQDLLIQGFGGVSAKIESKPPRHLRTVLGQLVNFFYTLQGESAGAVAVSNFDTLLAPFIRYDGLDFRQTKQAIQEYVFNINVPTRVGFQCVSEDTEILAQDGWKRYDQVQLNDIIATFNVEKRVIEYLPVQRVFAQPYKGKMYCLQNRISDQLLSPGHRVIRKKFNSDEYVLEPIEKVITLKSPFIVPVGSAGRVRVHNDKDAKSSSLDEDLIRLLAWIIADGSVDKSGRGSGRISIYQSKARNPQHYAEIIELCQRLELDYTERIQEGLGEPCNVIRFHAETTRWILHHFDSDKEQGIKFIPQVLLSLDAAASRVFVETYIKADGHDGCKITTTSEEIRDQLLHVIVHAGYGATVYIRKPDNPLSVKDRYIVRVIRHEDTYINTVEEIEYEGVIWCPNTANETVVARRNGKVFITGNTPFTNQTMDLTPPPTLRNQPVIVGGEPRSETYGEFQREMDVLNRAFAEVMLEGDAKGRVFTFPIPTYNVTPDFNWNNIELEPVWAMTARYGIPYWANFVNSDMSPEDARSMCCRLRLDNRELRKRIGGLFAAAPLTGSVGVVTLNMSRLGYLAHDETTFQERLEQLMEVARVSLEIKRQILERLTTQGLYPYSHHYLQGIKKRFGNYWSNHFSTIGLIGMNEACLNLLGIGIAHPDGKAFAMRTLKFMREVLARFQEETGQLYNLEATPAEGASFRLARADRERFPDIVTAGTDEAPFYTNSTHLPVNYTDDLFEALEHQDELQTLYTGGTVQHIFLGEQLDDWRQARRLVRTIAENFRLPYYTLTPTFSICPVHGYIAGEHKYCPYEHTEEELMRFGRLVKE